MSIWNEVLFKIDNKISKPSFDTWLANTTAEIKDNVVFVKSQNEFQAMWIEERYKSLLLATAEEVAGKSMEVHIINPDERRDLKVIPSEDGSFINAFEELK